MQRLAGIKEQVGTVETVGRREIEMRQLLALTSAEGKTIRAADQST